MNVSECQPLRHATFPGACESYRLETPNAGNSRLKRTGDTVPGTFIDLLPPEVKKSAVSAAKPQPSVPVPSAAVPKFGPPNHLMPDRFWSNLVQFLTERPIKISGNFRSPLMPASYGGGFSENLREFFSSRPAPKGPVRGGIGARWVTNFGGFGDRLKDFFFPAKLPPLRVTSKPVKVKEIWTKDENFGWTQVISVTLHVSAILLVSIPFLTHVLPTSTEAKTTFDVTPLDLSPYVTKLPAGAKKAGGGGGANDHTLTPPTKGKLPKFTWTQFAAPQARIVNPNPKLAMDPSLLGPPDLKVPSPNLPNFGDPLASAMSDSLGRGNGTGIGSGTGGGLGPGEGGGTGGGVFRAGVNGVGTPECLYCPDPLYSDEARKAKYAGSVVLDVIISADGRVTNIRVAKGVGLGLDEKAIESVKQWRLKPALGPNGKPVAVRMPIEVTFRLF
jgi:periplasmic protein TonB